MARRPKSPASPNRRAESYDHSKAPSLLRPDVGTQAHFRKKKPPATYRFDSSLSPALDWDGGNAAREQGEWLLACIEEAAALAAPHEFDSPREYRNARGELLASVRGLTDAVEQLRRLGRPFLDWTGKAERLSFDVPTLPLFVHERLSTKAILETLTSHKRDKQASMYELFGDPQLSIHDQVLRAYEYVGGWTNRMILGDSLVVMNSLLEYEGLGGQVQMIYMDPPYGVKFGSNFQPFVRRRDVKHNDDEDMTREPETVKAYRDTWELGLHSYLTYIRDRLLLCRALLAPSGSIFVQINDENLHYVRGLMDEVFGVENAVVTIIVKKKGATTPTDPVNDYLLWYARDKALAKPNVKQLVQKRSVPEDDPKFNTLIDNNGVMKRVTQISDQELEALLAAGARWARVNYPIVSQHYHPTRSQDYVFRGRSFSCGKNKQWRFEVPAGLDRLAAVGRLFDGGGGSLGGVAFWDDWPNVALSNVWDDLKGEEDPDYVVQTAWKVVQRCVLMTTDPGDLVLDPTCGSGTTAYVAEQWGRRWLTIDTSRVPLALARQRLLTATYPYHKLKDPERGPAGGFVYVRKQNSKGEEVGGIVPHVTLKSIANDEPAKEEVLVDRPEPEPSVVRVTGPFCVEATIPTPVDWEADGIEDSGVDPGAYGSFVERMLEVLRRAPVLHLDGGRTVRLRNLRQPAKTLSLSAEATVDASEAENATVANVTQEALERNGKLLPLSGKPVAIVFGPENGAVSEKLVFEAAREASAKSYSHLYVIGFAIQPHARKLVEDCEAVAGVPATYVQATPDLMMGDLLKTMRSSQIFSVCGLPDVRLRRVKAKSKTDPDRYEVELIGLDVFDPTTMSVESRQGSDVPAWLLDTNYNGLCFLVSQAFFPRTAAWDDLKRALAGQYDDTVWDHLAGTTSAPFEAGEHGQIAVKVIDDRGNELLVVKSIAEANH